ncbi:hypothetical protein [Azospirillum sp. sgz302134]
MGEAFRSHWPEYLPEYLMEMSINPARTLASAVPGGVCPAACGRRRGFTPWRRRLPGLHPVRCAKLNHDPHSRCIFCGQPARSPLRGVEQGGIHATN